MNKVKEYNEKQEINYNSTLQYAVVDQMGHYTSIELTQSVKLDLFVVLGIMARIVNRELEMQKWTK